MCDCQCQDRKPRRRLGVLSMVFQLALLYLVLVFGGGTLIHTGHPVAVEVDAAPVAAFAGGDAEARVFAAVALADRLDTLAGYFGIGESPTGSRDPFGLRRLRIDGDRDRVLARIASVVRRKGR